MTTPKYFAVPDPLDPDLITYWRRSAEGQLRPWPPKAKYRPLYPRDVPAELSPVERRAFLDAYREQLLKAYVEIRNTIEADPDTAAARFAAFHSRCCNCGKALTDDQSKVYGIGPDCRDGMSPEVLAPFVALIGRAHAKHLQREGDSA